ncbi:MAG: hypothetical protein CR997_12835 [Acidobacteria bacterium]|nr:MAG: hypothetical protein CR997_12835 [Acidobacteriota bacterium]
MKRVLVALPDQHVHSGVHERVRILAPHLKALGYETIALFPGKKNAVLLRKWPCPVTFYFGLYRPRKACWHNLKWILGLPFSVLSCWRAIRQLDADIIHTNGLLNIAPAIAARLARRKVIWHLIGDHYPKWTVKAVMPLVKRLSHKMVFVAERMLNYYSAKGSNKAVSILEPVCMYQEEGNQAALRNKLMEMTAGGRPPSSWSGDMERQTWIGAIGNLVPAKDWISFVEAAERLCYRYSHLRFVIMGGRSATQHAYAETVLKRVEKSDYRERFWLTGHVPHAGRFAGVLDVFMLASVCEGTPIAIVEAMLAGVPVVATDAGGVADMLSERRGLCCPAANPEALAKAVERVLAEREAHIDAREVAAWVEKHQPEKIAAEFCRLYQSLGRC